MNIALVTLRLIGVGGTDLHVARTARDLRVLGHDVTIYHAPHLTSTYEGTGADCVSIPSTNMKCEIETMLEHREELADLSNHDVVHVHTFADVAEVVQWVHRTPVVASMHNLPSQYPRHYRRTSGEWMMLTGALKRCDAVTVASRYMKGMIMGAHGVDAGIIPPRVNYADFRHMHTYRRSSSLRFASVGNLSTPKRQDHVVRAMAGIDAHLHLWGWGDTDHRDRIVQVASDAGVDSSKIVFRGHGDWWRERWDAVIVPTHEQEAYCMVKDEAMYLGYPTLVMEGGGAAENLESHGTLVRVADDMGSGLKVLMDDELRRELYASTREKFAEFSDPTSVLTSIYRSVIG